MCFNYNVNSFNLQHFTTGRISGTLNVYIQLKDPLNLSIGKVLALAAQGSRSELSVDHVHAGVATKSKCFNEA